MVAGQLRATLSEGELVCLIGRNGAGKSTLLRTLAAFQSPLAGRITITTEGDTLDITAGETSNARLSRIIGVVLTERPDLQNMTVFDLAALGRSPYTGFFGKLSDADRAIVSDSLRMVGMTAFSDRMVNTLSDGERQKVMIAKALAQQTPFIFLDEPTAFLDYPSKIDTMLMLQRLCHSQRKAVLISTHDLDIALRYCDSVWHMKDGVLQTGITDATPEDFI